MTKKSIQELTLPSERAIAKRNLRAFAVRVEQQLEQAPTEELAQLIDDLHTNGNVDYRDIAIALAALSDAPGAAKREKKPQAKATASAYDGSTQPSEKRPAKERKREKSGDNSLGQASPLKGHPEIPMERFRVEVGRKHGVEPREIMGAVANEAGIEGEFIGLINIQENYSTIDLPEGMPKPVLKHLKKTRVKGVNLGMVRVG